MPNTKSFLLDHTRLLTALASLLLSIVLVVTDDIINKDGILYLETAAAFLSGGISAAFELFNWPFHAVLIAGLHKLTGLPLEVSGYVLGTLLFILLTDSLYLICRKILPSRQHIFIAMIIFLAFHSLNEYRDFIIRDPGYWAFSTFGLYLFIRFLENPRWHTALYWQISMLSAILFRIEAAVLLVTLPFYSLFHFSTIRSKVSHYFQLNILPFFALFFAASSQSIQSLIGSSDRLNRLMHRDLPGVLHHFEKKSDQIVQHLPIFTHDHAAIIFFTGLLGLITIVILEMIQIGYLGFYIAARWNKPAPKLPHRKFLRYALIINGLILISFAFTQFFMITRYCIMFTLILLLLMLPAITAYILAAWHNRKRFILALFIIVLLALIYASITYSVSKSYIKKTAVWASEQSPNNHLIATDDVFIHYYFNAHATQSGHHPITLLQTEDSTDAYDQLIYVEKRKHPLSKTRLNMLQSRQIIYSQQNQHGDKASIYE